MKAPLVSFLLGLLVLGLPLHGRDASFPSQKTALAALSPAGFNDKAMQIPATVIDVGRLRYVPYVSFKVGDDRELNVYGDPASPACVEIGLYRGLLNSDAEKHRCVAYLRRLFPEIDFGNVRIGGGKLLKGGVVVEITLPTAPDAYGGWWISVYSLPLLNGSAGTSANVSLLSVPRQAAAAAMEWTSVELNRARPAAPGSEDRVYVRSFLRQAGEYVRLLTDMK